MRLHPWRLYAPLVALPVLLMFAMPSTVFAADWHNQDYSHDYSGYIQVCPNSTTPCDYWYGDTSGFAAWHLSLVDSLTIGQAAGYMGQGLYEYTSQTDWGRGWSAKLAWTIYSSQCYEIYDHNWTYFASPCLNDGSGTPPIECTPRSGDTSSNLIAQRCDRNQWTNGYWYGSNPIWQGKYGATFWSPYGTGAINHNRWIGF